MIGVLEEICLFFNFSPKRQQEPEAQIKKLPIGQSSRTKLVNMCKIHWVARIEGFEVFQDLLPAVVSTLEVISTVHGWNAESSRKAASLLTSLTQFEFLMALVVVQGGLGFIKGLTTSL